MGDKSSENLPPEAGSASLSTWERRLAEAKRKHRPYMKNWSSGKFTSDRSADLAQLTERRAFEFCKNIDRVHCDHLSEKDFIKKYEAPALPVVIGGIPQRESWAALLQSKWTDWEWLRTNLGERLFKVGEDDDGFKVKVKFKYFLRYLRENVDDSPLYVFDSTFDDDSVASCLLNDYTKPKYFRDDLFSLVGERRRPPYRWWLCGPARSGTCVHIDPLGTSAWNTLLVGRKRWVIFPPATLKKIAKATSFVRKNEDDEAVNYFVDHLPRLLRQMRHDERQWAQRGARDDVRSTGSSSSSSSSSSSGHTSSAAGSSTCSSSSSSSSSSDDGEQQQQLQDPRTVYGCSSHEVIEFTQYPGETVFVPGYWWHAVLNLDDTVAVTQNFCSVTNFDQVWKETRSGRKKMACKWLRRLREQHPELADKAEAANKADGFLMYYEKRAKREQRRQAKREREREKERERGADKAATRATAVDAKPAAQARVDDAAAAAARATPDSDSDSDSDTDDSAGKSDGGSQQDSKHKSKKNRKGDDGGIMAERKNFKHESKYDAERREAKTKQRGGAGAGADN